MKLTSPILTLRKGFTLIELMVVIGILALLASVAIPVTLAQLNKGDQSKAKSNLSELNKMFRGFKTDNGEYPSDNTAELLAENNPDYDFGDLQGNNSNAYFRQFFYDSSTDSEAPFYAKISVVGNKTVEGDGVLANGEALKPGENGMSYVMRKNNDDDSIKLSSSASNIPLAMTSVFPSARPYAGDKLVIDNSSFKGVFIVLGADGSVKNADENLVEDDEDETKATFAPDKPSIFPPTKKGKPTAGRYLVLTPEFK